MFLSQMHKPWNVFNERIQQVEALVIIILHRYQFLENSENSILHQQNILKYF